MFQAQELCTIQGEQSRQAKLDSGPNSQVTKHVSEWPLPMGKRFGREVGKAIKKPANPIATIQGNRRSRNPNSGRFHCTVSRFIDIIFCMLPDSARIAGVIIKIYHIISYFLIDRPLPLWNQR
jgi:hypothetical protein